MHWKWGLLAIPVVALLVLVTHEHLGLWPSIGFFTAVFVLGFFLYRRESRGLTAILKPLAARYDGSLKPATPLSYPQLRFEAGERRFAVHFMPSAGTSALPGPFTSVALSLPFDSACQADVKRAPALVRGAVAALVPEWQTTTGDDAFDRAFRLEGRDQASLAERLDDGLRAGLMATQLPALHLRIRGPEITVFIDGLAKTNTEIEAMIALAGALADRCTDPVA